MFTTAITALLVVLTLVAMRGFRRTLDWKIALLGIAPPIALAIAGRHMPLITTSKAVIVGAAILIACMLCAIAYVALAFTRPRGPVDLSRRWALGFLALPILGYAIVHGWNRPDPTSFSSCTEAGYWQSDGHVVDGDLAIAGPIMRRGDTVWLPRACDLEVRRNNDIIGTIDLSPPWGVSGGSFCGSGEIILCSRAGLIVVSDSPAEPMTPSSVRSWQLPQFRQTSGDVVSNDRVLAFPTAFEILLAAGTIVLAFALVRKRAASAMPAMGAYRTTDAAIPETKGGMHAAVIAWMIASAPLVTAVVGSVFRF